MEKLNFGLAFFVWAIFEVIKKPYSQKNTVDFTGED